MIVTVFDIISILGFAVAAASGVYAYVAFRDRIPRSVTLFATGAMLVMTVVALGNALADVQVTGALESREGYIEVLFIPMIVYLTYSARTYSEKVQVEREKAIVGRLDSRLAESLAELGVQRLEMLQALTAAVDARDRYTALHSMHVADYASAIAYRLGMRDKLTVFEQAGLLHDIGKIGVSDSLLLKPMGLTDSECAMMRGHVEESARILLTVPFLSDVVPLVRHHHERWDRTGYPDGLAGESIPQGARVLAVADAFDAMTTDRPYRKALDVEIAREALIDGRGTQFDPVAVDAFVQLLDEGLVAVARKSEVA